MEHKDKDIVGWEHEGQFACADCWDHFGMGDHVPRAHFVRAFEADGIECQCCAAPLIRP